ncbi:MAG: hypothetical protein D6718_02880 [Acidobacteria bacterium]|nr:MAG: hypothetical protein D6718_02880 [Acidobacteriota bacterium]
MSLAETIRRWRPGPVALVAGGLIGAGFLLTGVSWWFFLLVGLGTFGPGVLRELGWLRDKDEFQRLAAYRAGYHAYLATGFAGVLFVAYLRSGVRELRHPEELATFFLGLVWFSWILSTLINFWGPVRAARRLLVGFGCAWLAFAIASNVGSEWTGWPALLLEPLLTVPFFALAWAAGHFPRTAGALLLLSCAALFVGLGFWRVRLGLAVTALTVLLFLGPLLASGLALLAAPREREPAPETGGTG